MFLLFVDQKYDKRVGICLKFTTRLVSTSRLKLLLEISVLFLSAKICTVNSNIIYLKTQMCLGECIFQCKIRNILQEKEKTNNKENSFVFPILSSLPFFYKTNFMKINYITVLNIRSLLYYKTLSSATFTFLEELGVWSLNYSLMWQRDGNGSVRLFKCTVLGTRSQFLLLGIFSAGHYEKWMIRTIFYFPEGGEVDWVEAEKGHQLARLHSVVESGDLEEEHVVQDEVGIVNW